MASMTRVTSADLYEYIGAIIFNGSHCGIAHEHMPQFTREVIDEILPGDLPMSDMFDVVHTIAKDFEPNPKLSLEAILYAILGGPEEEEEEGE